MQVKSVIVPSARSGNCAVEDGVTSAVRAGLSSLPKRLPPWLFYDEAGSLLFEAITELPEYYLTRTERGILAASSSEILERAAEGRRLRIAELGAGSADKTRLLLKAAVDRQGTVIYEPVDVSASALEAARERIEREIDGVTVVPRVMDYTRGLELEPFQDCCDVGGELSHPSLKNRDAAKMGHPDAHVDIEAALEGGEERRLVLYIGSSIGNFDPHEAAGLLKCVREALRAGDCLLLGVDLVKDESTLLAAYDDAAGVTAAFNRNLLVRLNRELGAEFDLGTFAHRAVWNAGESRMEMHLESLCAQRVRMGEMGLSVEFGCGESIHTENSYKYLRGQAEGMLAEAGFAAAGSWTDERGWFGVCLGRAL